MAIEICAVGGYSEVGRNMTALKIDDEVIILDMGMYIPAMVDFEEAGGSRDYSSTHELIAVKAIPDDKVISDWKDKVKAIIVTHCHLDHIAAIPYLAPKYNCPIIGTPYSMEVLKTILHDQKHKLKNPLRVLNANSKMRISKNIEIEFINMTHSTLQVVMVAIHTREGTIIYANDFKFDNHPVLGKKPNYELLKKIGEGNVLALIADSLYSNSEMKTPSEKVAKEMLKDVMLGTTNEGRAIIVTTFASHIARLDSIVEFSKKLNRKLVFLGRSMDKYVRAAENLKLVNFSDHVEIIGFAGMIKRKLKHIEREGREKYVIVCTGNQGEPKAVLSKIASGQFKFNFMPEDHVIFACRTIPHPTNVKNRAVLEKKLKDKRVRIFTNIHTSGHAAREDLRDLVDMLKPQHIIPAHGDREILEPFADLAKQMDYTPSHIHVLKNGQRIKLI